MLNFGGLLFTLSSMIIVQWKTWYRSPTPFSTKNMMLQKKSISTPSSILTRPFLLTPPQQKINSSQPHLDPARLVGIFFGSPWVVLIHHLNSEPTWGHPGPFQAQSVVLKEGMFHLARLDRLAHTKWYPNGAPCLALEFGPCFAPLKPQRCMFMCDTTIRFQAMFMKHPFKR